MLFGLGDDDDDDDDNAMRPELDDDAKRCKREAKGE